MSTTGQRTLRIETTGVRPLAHHASASLRAIVGDVSWTPSYVAFLVYIFVIVTYRFPIGELAMVVALVGLLLEPGRFRMPPFLVWLAALIAWAAVGYGQTTYATIVRTNLDAFARLWLLALVAVNVLKTGPRIRFFLIFFLVLFITHPVRGALFNNYVYSNTVAGRFVWTGIFSNPNDLAALTLLPLGIAAALARDPNRWIRRGAQVSVALLVGIILMTQSRGGLLALAFFGLLVAFSSVSSRRRLQSLAALGILAVGAVIASPQGAIDRMTSLADAVVAHDLSEADESDSALQRYTIWKVARRISREHPVYGVGLGAYPKENEKVAGRDYRTDLAAGERDAHSTYLTMLAETGFPGLFLFLGMILHTLLRSRTARRRAANLAPSLARQSWFLEAALVAYLAAGVFGSYGHLSFLYIQFAVLAAATHRLEVRIRWPQRAPTRPLPQASPRLPARRLSGT